jgi:hypothetical protein
MNTKSGAALQDRDQLVDPGAPPARRARRWRWLVLYAVYLVLLLELGARSYFAIAKAGFFLPDVRWSFYPEARVEQTAGALNVLLLGGSVLNAGFGDIAPGLEADLTARLQRKVAVHDLAMPAHTSRDSLNKYRLLAGHHFDLVVVYHGINEARMNNCPPDLWRDDYTHVAWYARYDAIAAHPECPVLVAPYALHELAIELGELTGLMRFVPRSRPKDEWLDYGANVRSAASLRANLLAIAAIARERSEALMFLTFATHVPAGYDLDRPRAQQAPGVNDYAARTDRPIEIWGRSRNVLAAVQAHNAVIRSLPGMEVVDLAERMPDDGKLFVDVCHLSAQGCAEFVRITAPEIARTLAK